MSVETDLVAYLSARHDVSQALTAIRPLAAFDTDEPPYLCYEITTRPRDVSQAGETGLSNLNLRLNVFAPSYAEVRVAEKALRNAFYSFQQTEMGDTFVQWAQLRDTNDDDQPPIFRNQFGMFQGVHSLSLWYNEPVPA